VFEAFGTQCEMRLHHIVIPGLSGCTIRIYPHSYTNGTSKKKIVSSNFATNFVWNASRFNNNWARCGNICTLIFVYLNFMHTFFCFTISLFHASTCFEHMCSKHVEAWNKLIVKFCASSWLITEINILRFTVSKTSKIGLHVKYLLFLTDFNEN